MSRNLFTDDGGDPAISLAGSVHVRCSDRVDPTKVEDNDGGPPSAAHHYPSRRVPSAAALNLVQRVAQIGVWEMPVVPGESIRDRKAIFSDEMLAILGIHNRTSDVIHGPLREIFPSEIRDKVISALDATVSDRSSTSFETRVLNAEREVLHARLTTEIVKGDDEVLWMVGMIQDLSDQKRREDLHETTRGKLSSTEVLLRAVTDSTTDAIFVKDRDGRYLFFNAAAAYFVGKSIEEVLGNDDLELFGPEGYEVVRDTDLAVMASGQAETREEKLTAAGVTRTYLTTKAPFRGETGEILGTIGISRDITEKKVLESQFFRTQRMESIGTLAGGIAHDLNNVLTPITMSVDLLRKEEDPESRRELLESIEISASRGTEMVKQVLTFARGVDGRRLQVKLAAILKELTKFTDETFLKNVVVESNIDEGLWSVAGDPTQIHQVLLNLSVNARDAMPDGGLLRFRAFNLEVDEQYASSDLDTKPGRYVAIEVSDTGEGMPPDVVERIFEPFFTTKELGKGTGLGLSTSLAIVKSHDGFVNVTSEPGRGTIFRVHFPAVASEDDCITTTEETDLLKGSGETILVIDDEPAIRQITKCTLERAGYHVLLAADGAEATALFAMQKEEIALVFTDMMMQTMDGASALHAIGRIKPGVAMIAASGVHTEAMEAKAMAAGVSFFLAKPYPAATLLGAIRKALANTGS